MRRALLLALLVLAALPGVAAAQECATSRTIDPAIPTWEEVNGYPLGTRQATNEEVGRFLTALDRASDRVRGGELARRSWAGRPMPWVLVALPELLRDAALERTAAAARRLRRGTSSPRESARIARDEPAFAWMTANVHGNEPSGTDGSMKLLYELVARTDCANVKRLRRLVTVFLPLQNPDGRRAASRTNAYGFDMNRDWFARTQPETDAKLELLRRFPPILFVDAHEQGGTGYFFPPNADPIHHEVPGAALFAINEVYGPAMRRAFERRGYEYTNYTTYDLFYMGYGDTVPSTSFGAAGMTFEKGGQAPYPEKTEEQFVTQDASLTAAADRKAALVRRWAAQWPEARRQGRAGRLEPNVVVQPQNRVRFQVPDRTIRYYAIRSDESAPDAARLVNRLRSFDVEVRRLRRPLRVRRFHDLATNGGTRRTRLPAGTYLVPMAQAQKHWVQALLGEDTYVPFPYFYDVSGWSNPLLMGLRAGTVGDRLRLTRRLARRVGVAQPHRRPAADAPAYAFSTGSAGALELVTALLRRGVPVSRVPGSLRVGGRQLGTGAAVIDGVHRTVLAELAADRRVPVEALRERPARTTTLRRPRVALVDDPAPLGESSSGWTRYVLAERMGLDVVRLDLGDLETGGLRRSGADALVVPDALVPDAGISAVGLQAIRAFVRGGGTYVGFREPGVSVARGAGITGARVRQTPDDVQIPGVLVRTLVDPSDPVAWGFRGTSFAFNAGDPLLVADRPVVRYPDDRRFFVSGYAEGTGALRGTTAVVDERVGEGRAVVFAFDPHFRAFHEAGQRLVANALLAPPDAGTGSGRRARAAGRVSPGAVRGIAPPGRDAVVRVGLADADRLRAAARAAGVPGDAVWEPGLRGLVLRVPNPRRLDASARGWPARLMTALRDAGVRPEFAAF